MTSIADLSLVDSVSASDNFPILDASSNRERACTAAQIADYVAGVIAEDDTAASQHYLQVRNVGASVALSTSAGNVLVLPTAVENNGTTYDTTTGEITFNKDANYTISLRLNADNAASRDIYAYVNENTGSGYVIDRYSAQRMPVVTGAVHDATFLWAGYYQAGTKLKLSVWASGAVNILSADVAGTTAGTVTIPAAELSIVSS